MRVQSSESFKTFVQIESNFMLLSFLTLNVKLKNSQKKKRKNDVIFVFLFDRIVNVVVACMYALVKLKKIVNH